jgi:competence CoiA-like predicted nuclease
MFAGTGSFMMGAGRSREQPSLCVAKPEITDVIDFESGELLRAEDAIGSDYLALEQLRMRLATARAKKERLYVCAICGVSVYLVCQRRKNQKLFHFRHTLEDGRCSARTRGKLTEAQIRACKYNGVKESPAHIRMKEIIAQSLACDPEFSDIAVEKVWKSQDRKSWRKPDVSALWRGTIRVAFEIQLSTTFLRVIAERREHYLREGGLLCWVFQRFDADAALMTQDDVFFNNNQNLFLASVQTLEASRSQKALVLDCHWTLPAVDKGGNVVDQWDGRNAHFSEFTLDRTKQARPIAR